MKFRSERPGKWTERWFLSTAPRLGPGRGVDIYVSFWYMALDEPQSLVPFLALDRHLQTLAAESMASRTLHDLVSCLPLDMFIAQRQKREVVKIERAVRPEDVLAFEEKYPGLRYNSLSMYHLLGLQSQLEELQDCRDDEGEFEEFLRRYRPILSPVSPEPIATSVRASVAAEMKRKSIVRPRSMTRHIDSFHRERASINLKQLRRELLALDEDFELKEEMLERMNKAVTGMLFQHSQPVGDFKHQFFKMALARALDDVAQEEWRLRKNLRLLDDPRATARATFPFKERHPRRATESSAMSRASSVDGDRSHPQVELNLVVDTIVDECLEEVMQDSQSDGFLDTETTLTGLDTPLLDSKRQTLVKEVGSSESVWMRREELRKSYDDKLYAIVYARLGQFVESLHSLMAQQSPLELNPFGRGRFKP